MPKENNQERAGTGAGELSTSGEARSSEWFTLQAVTLILHLMRNLRTVSGEINFDIELSYPQILMLYALLEKGTSTMSDLSRWLKVSQGVATRTVDRLVEKGVARRRHDDKDRRVVLVSLTEEGREYAERIISVHLDKLDRILSDIPDEKKSNFLEMLKEIDCRLEE